MIYIVFLEVDKYVIKSWGGGGGVGGYGVGVFSICKKLNIMEYILD